MTTVLVPIHDAAAATAACLAALARAVDAETPVLLIDDASTDPAIAPMLAAFAATRPATRVIGHVHNLGFVATANHGFAACLGDVLLLNSDTLPTPGFLARMLRTAATDPGIASVTPFSNNAEICSFPGFCQPNPVPAEPDAVAAAFADEPANGVDLPTAVGFCMWMRRSALVAIGDFDQATFGRGYGEENDWCLRAAAHGWRNVLCPSAYVAHIGHASFAATGERPGGSNLARLVARYPGYNAGVADFIARDPLSGIRARVSARLDAAAS
jgi:GT2 family glycosyltransferase